MATAVAVSSNNGIFAPRRPQPPRLTDIHRFALATHMHTQQKKAGAAGAAEVGAVIGMAVLPVQPSPTSAAPADLLLPPDIDPVMLAALLLLAEERGLPRPVIERATGMVDRAIAATTAAPSSSPPANLPAPVLLPEILPRACCFNNFTCGNRLRWRVAPRGVALAGYFCRIHFELFMETRFVQDYSVIRL